MSRDALLHEIRSRRVLGPFIEDSAAWRAGRTNNPKQIRAADRRRERRRARHRLKQALTPPGDVG
jgi:hypothetical protein